MKGSVLVFTLAVVSMVGCGTRDTLEPEVSPSSDGSAQSAADSPGDAWVSGSIPSDSASASQLGGGESEDAESFEDGIEFWTGGSLTLSADGRAEGFGEFAIVQVDYAADEEVMLCYVSWSIQSVRSLDSCRDCAWAFEVETGAVDYEDGSQEACLQNGFEPEQFEFALLNIAAREGDFLMIEQDDWEPVGEVAFVEDEGTWEYELFMGEDD